MAASTCDTLSHHVGVYCMDRRDLARTGCMETRGPSNSCFDTPALPAVHVVSPDGRWPAFGAPRREDAMVWAWSGLWAGTVLSAIVGLLDTHTHAHTHSHTWTELLVTVYQLDVAIIMHTHTHTQAVQPVGDLLSGRAAATRKQFCPCFSKRQEALLFISSRSCTLTQLNLRYLS